MTPDRLSTDFGSRTRKDRGSESRSREAERLAALGRVLFLLDVLSAHKHCGAGPRLGEPQPVRAATPSRRSSHPSPGHPLRVTDPRSESRDGSFEPPLRLRRAAWVLALASLLGLSLGAPKVAAGESAGPVGSIWKPNPYIFLDPDLVSTATNLVRRPHPPARFPEPIVTGFEDGNFQPWLTVLRDPATRRFRLWYNTPRTPGNTGESSIAYLESEDGLHWIRPHRVLRDPAPIQFGASVIDEGPAFPRPAERFKLAWWKDGGLRLARSPDGLEWTALGTGPLLRHNHDITGIHWDPLRQRYLALISVVPGDGPFKGLRIPHQSVSADLANWAEPWPIVTPHPTARIEQGETQFYGMSAVLARGELLVSMVKVLRDDLNCEPDRTAAQLHDPGRPFAGLGYSVVAWSRDGVRWDRETEPFLDRNSQPGTWDRAMAWIDDQLLVGDYAYLYYGGYRWGHKAERFTGRQIGFAQMPRDRYVAYEAGETEGGLVTAPRRVEHPFRLTVNAQVTPAVGDLRVRVVRADGECQAGFDWGDGSRIQGDRVDHAVGWRGSTADLVGQTVRLEFRLNRAKLFAFDLE